MSRSIALRSIIAIAAILGASVAAHAQAAQPLVTQPVDPAHLATLRGNTHPMALAKYDRGAAPTGLPMAHMMLVLRRSAQQEASLDTLLAQQQDRTSANYHKWLTPEQFGSQFGPTETDIQTITSWLESQGFHVNKVANGRNMIDFSGTAGTVQSALHTTIHKYVYANGVQHWANSTDPQIPAALANAVIGVDRLNDFHPKRMSRNLGAFRKSLVTGKVSKVTPQYTESGVGCYGTGTNCYAVAPYDFAKIYNVSPLWTAGTTGSGQTIAIVSDSDVVTTDYTQFRSIFGLPAITLNRVLPTKTNPGVQNCEANSDEEEAILDVEWAGAVAPGATIDLVISPTSGDCTGSTGETGFEFGGDYSAQYVVDNNTAPILSDSYGECEYGLGTAENAFYNKLWQQAAGEGITVSVASGDSGSAGCDYYDLSSGDNDLIEPAQYGLAVNGTASTPYDIAVGGTDFYYSNFDNPSQYWSSSNTSSGTTSTTSVLGYIPEMAWNDSCADFVFYQGLISGLPNPGNPEAACNNSTLQFYDLVGPAGGSGGASNCVSAPTNNANEPTGCSGGYPKPSWQAGTGVPSDGVRDIPDISLFAGDGEVSGTFYAECEADLEYDEDLPSGLPCSTTLESDDGTPYVEVEGVGGTSVSAQVFAGAMALLNQKQGRQGNLNPLLYALAKSESASSCNSSSPASTCIFHDVVAGSNVEPCVPDSLNCTLSKSGDSIGVLSGFSAGTGFDLATGLGTPNISNLISGAGSLSFYLSAASPTVTIASGSSTGTLSISAAAVTNFIGQLSSFTCAGLPAGATCAASQPISLTGTGTTGSTTLTITLASAAASVRPMAAPLTPSNRMAALLANRATLPLAFTLGLSLIALLAFFANARRSVVTAFAIVLFGFLVMTSACGGGGGSSSGGGGGGGGGTTGTSYTVVVTGATSTGTPSSTVTFTLVVD
jgi:subtilase family serine protease